MSKVKQFHTPIDRKRHTDEEWEFREKIGDYEVYATEYVIEGRSAWLVKVDGKTYWTDNGNVSRAKFDGCIEKFADPIGVNLEGCIREALRNFELATKPH
jgi:hypothetical protein